MGISMGEKGTRGLITSLCKSFEREIFKWKKTIEDESYVCDNDDKDAFSDWDDEEWEWIEDVNDDESESNDSGDDEVFCVPPVVNTMKNVTPPQIDPFPPIVAKKAEKDNCKLCACCAINTFVIIVTKR
jgi:hypothetical protein